MGDTSPSTDNTPQDESEARAKPSTAKILDDIVKVKPPRQTRAQVKARRRVVVLFVLLLPVLGGIAWLAWQQWQLGSRLPALESRVASVQGGTLTSPAAAMLELTSEQEARVGVLLADIRAELFTELSTELTKELSAELATELSAALDARFASLDTFQAASQDPARDRRIAELAAQASQSAFSELDTRVALQQGTVATEITQLRNQVAQLGARLRGTERNPNRGWKLLEAEYLLAMAGRKLRHERDLATAVELFELADQALADSASDEVYPLRQALARELASLRDVQLPDVDSLFLRLDILAAQVQSLALAGSSIGATRARFESPQESTQENPQQSEPRLETEAEERLSAAKPMNDALEFLSSVFVWRELDESAQSLIAEGANDVREYSLLLEQAKLALLRNDAILFSRQLRGANVWLERYAQPDNVGVVAARAELDALLLVDIAPPLPVLGDALRGVSDLNASGAQ